MQRKKQVEAQIEEVRAAINTYRQTEKRILSDPNLSAQGKGNRCAEEKNKLAQRCKSLLNQAAATVREACAVLERMQAADNRKTDDTAHQLRLANAIKALELRGRTMTGEEIAELVTPLAHDRLAKMTLVAAAQAGGCDPLWIQPKLDALFDGVQNRSETVKKLRELEAFVLGLWNRYGTDLTDFEGCMVVTSRLLHWNDDLTRWSMDGE